MKCLKKMYKKEKKKELPDWLTVTAHNPLYHCGKISHRTQHWMETVTQSDLARNLQPNHEDSIVTQPLWERKREKESKVEGENPIHKSLSWLLIPQRRPDLQTMNHTFALTWRQTHRYNLSSHMYSHMANGCASLSPIIKLFLSFHQGDGGRGQSRDGEGGGGGSTGQTREVERWGIHTGGRER